jgi:hypothetical protein
MCKFFEWIDGPEAFDPQILLFSYDRSESSLLRSFKYWVSPPPNAMPMIDEDMDEASTHRVHNKNINYPLDNYEIIDRRNRDVHNELMIHTFTNSTS